MLYDEGSLCVETVLRCRRAVIALINISSPIAESRAISPQIWLLTPPFLDRVTLQRPAVRSPEAEREVLVCWFATHHKRFGCSCIPAL